MTQAVPSVSPPRREDSGEGESRAYSDRPSPGRYDDSSRRRDTRVDPRLRGYERERDRKRPREDDDYDRRDRDRYRSRDRYDYSRRGDFSDDGETEVEVVSSEESKRLRRECFRCGGRNHVVMVCTSTERDACKNLSLPKCRRCDGRGHLAERCPTVINANPCYRCREPGHLARHCPYDNNLPPSQNHHSSNGPPPHHAASQRLHASAMRMFNGYASQHGYNADSAEVASALATAMPYGDGGGSSYGGTTANYGDVAPWCVPYLEYGLRAATEYAAAAAGAAYGSVSGAPPPPPRSMGGGASDRGGRDNRRDGGGDLYGGGSYGGGSYGGRPPTRREQSGKCFRCGTAGHWTRDCPLRPRDADPTGCYKCGRRGHKSKECNACYRCGRDGHRAADCAMRRRGN